MTIGKSYFDVIKKSILSKIERNDWLRFIMDLINQRVKIDTEHFNWNYLILPMDKDIEAETRKAIYSLQM